MDAVQNQAPIFSSPYYYDNALTAESMMVYLTTRLGGIDEQIQGFFKSQEQSEEIRAAFNEIKRLLNELSESTDKDHSIKGKEDVLASIASTIDEIASMDPNLAERITNDLTTDDHILHVADPGDTNIVYTTREVENTRSYFDNLAGQLESTAQMNMIQLQSLMSARQTAISLATNLLAKHDESLKKVVDNIR
ncbi:MAG TPA: hypothetical protein VI197_35435 [Polyangiaceae bacterium]